MVKLPNHFASQNIFFFRHYANYVLRAELYNFSIPEALHLQFPAYKKSHDVQLSVDLRAQLLEHYTSIT